MCAAYGFTPSTVRDMTPAELSYLLEHLPDVELRRTYPVAALEATLLNALGGKPDKKDDGKKLAPHLVYTAFERLPWFARPSWVAETTVISAETARDFLRHVRRLPAWAVSIAPVDELTRAAES